MIDLGGNQVAFRFYNTGPLASSITDVYFDDGSLLSISSITNGTGVEFEEGASPGVLPGGNAINFNQENGNFFTADSNSPTQPNGVNPGEELTITFLLKDLQTFANVINALALSLASPGVDVEGGLRIGIHVQGFSNGGSESFVNGPSPGPPDPGEGDAPAPGGLVLLASMLPFAWGLRRRLTKSEVAA